MIILTSQVYAASESTPSGKRERVEDLKDRMKDKFEDKRDIMEVKKRETRLRLEEKREMMATKAAALKERLEDFRDKIKANIIEKVSNALNRINDNRTERMQAHLDKMSEIVVKLENRLAEASSSARNTASASAAITSAKETIDVASEAVAKQAEKDYTVNVSTEKLSRAETKDTRDVLHNDLQSVKRLVVDAKHKVAMAIRSVAQTLGGIKSGK